jgi:glycine/D-amino acid oxidase-like deaminating enzyme
MRHVDVAIVGQGLAGTALAWHLRWAGARTLVVDREPAVTASRVAAGLVTPVTGKRLARTWRLDDLLPAAVAFYRRVEAETGTPVFHPRRMVRLFRDDAERAAYAGRAAGFGGLVADPDPPPDGRWFAAPLGGFEMPTAAQLDVPRYLDASRRHFADGYLRADVDPVADVALSPGRVDLPRLGVTADRLVFAQGFAAVGNPWFPRVRWNAARGDILTVRVPGLDERRIVHRGVWLAPAGGDLFRAGSTYDRSDLTDAPTAAGRDEVCGRLRAFLRPPFEVVDHRAAVRPIVLDQRPVIGLHPDHPQLGYFNGLGSKGTLQAPFVAARLADLLTAGRAADPELDLGRWAG